MAIFDPDYFTGTEWFVRDGDFYVSSIGDDVTGNGEPLLPFATIQKAISVATSGNKIVVGNGNYNEIIDGQAKDLILVADQEVIMKYTASLETAFSNMGTSSSISGFRIESYANAIDGAIDSIDNCLIINTQIINYAGIIKGSILKDVTLTTSGATQLFSNTFIALISGTTASSTNQFTDIYDCHFSNDSSLEINSAVTINFDHCNQQPGSYLSIDGNLYANASAVHTAFPQYQAQGINTAPGFNRPADNDYSLTSTSALRNAGRYYRQIGARSTGFNRHGQNMTGGYQLQNVYKDAFNRYTLVDGYEEGTITTPVLNLGQVRTLGIIRLFAEQQYEIPPENAVVDYRNENRPPNAISFRMRYALKSNKMNSAQYQEFVWNRIPTVDSAGKGNGDAEFEYEEQSFISAQYVQLIITLRKSENTYYLVQENDDCILQENDFNIIWKY